MNRFKLAALISLALIGAALATPVIVTLVPTTGPPFPTVNYWTSTTIPASSGANFTFNQGGLCPVVASGAAPHCGNVPVGNQGPQLDANRLIPLAKLVPQRFKTYMLIVGISNVTSGQSYQVTLRNNTTGISTNLGIPASGNGNQVQVTLNDGLAPASYSIGITNDAFANQSPQLTNLDSEFQLTVTQNQVSNFVFPASQFFMGAGVIIP